MGLSPHRNGRAKLRELPQARHQGQAHALGEALGGMQRARLLVASLIKAAPLAGAGLHRAYIKHRALLFGGHLELWKGKPQRSGLQPQRVGREKVGPQTASFTMVPYSLPGEPEKTNQEAAECPGKKAADFLNSLGLGFLVNGSHDTCAL